MSVRLIISFWVGLLIGSVLATAVISLSPQHQTSRTEQVFAYGTLTNPLIRSLTCRCLTSGTPATLEGYQKQARNIIRESNASVTGILFSVTPTELRRLDQYEQVPKKYLRATTTIGTTTAWIYHRSTTVF